jgi:hypothetical protein
VGFSVWKPNTHFLLLFEFPCLYYLPPLPSLSKASIRRHASTLSSKLDYTLRDCSTPKLMFFKANVNNSAAILSPDEGDA